MKACIIMVKLPDRFKRWILSSARKEHLPIASQQQNHKQRVPLNDASQELIRIENKELFPHLLAGIVLLRCAPQKGFCIRKGPASLLKVLKRVRRRIRKRLIWDWKYPSMQALLLLTVLSTHKTNYQPLMPSSVETTSVINTNVVGCRSAFAKLSWSWLKLKQPLRQKPDMECLSKRNIIWNLFTFPIVLQTFPELPLLAERRVYGLFLDLKN